MTTNELPVKAVGTTSRIIEFLRHNRPAGVSEVSDALDIPKSTVHDHLRSLEAESFIISDGGEYRLSTRFLEIGGHVRSRLDVFQTAVPEVQKLARETGELANLMIEENGEGVFIFVARGPSAVQIGSVHYTGTRAKLHTTALGKAMLASMSRDRVDEIIDQHGLEPANEHTITDRDELFEQLDAIRERGYALDDAERVDGMRCVGAAIDTAGDSDGPAGAVSVSAPINRLQGERFEVELPEHVTRTTNVIEVSLAYS